MLYKIVRIKKAATKQKDPMAIITMLPITTDGEILKAQTAFQFANLNEFQVRDIVDLTVSSNKKGYAVITNINRTAQEVRPRPNYIVY